MDIFISQLSRNEANNLAQKLSQTYTTTEGWEAIDATLSETGYRYDNERGEHTAGGEAESEVFHIDRIRVVIVDLEGIVVHDNFSQLTSKMTAPNLAGQRTPIKHLDTNNTVGYAYVDVHHNFLATESLGFLRGSRDDGSV